MLKSFYKGFSISKIFLLVLFFQLFVLSETNFAQRTSVWITEQGFNKLIIKSGSNTEFTIPVSSSSNPQHNDNSVENGSLSKNTSTNDWTLLKTINGVGKAISFATPTIGFIAAEGGIVYKTTDGGNNWNVVLNTGYPNYWYGVHAFSKDKVIITGFNNSLYAAYSGFLRWTTNGGTTWTSDIIISPGIMNWLMSVGFADSLHGMAAGHAGNAGTVFVTSNGGKEATDWTQKMADPYGGWFSGNFTIGSDGKYYITGVNFCKSTNYGVSWTFRHSIDSVYDNGVCFADDLHGWTGGGTISPTQEGWAHRTTDGGATWSGRILTLPYPIRVIHFFDAMNGFAQGGNGAAGGIWESKDGGITWIEAVNTSAEMGSLDWQRVSPDSIDVWTVGFTPAGGSWHSLVYKKRMAFGSVPVELTSFTANVKNNKVILGWTTATEKNNRGFEIQRSSSLQSEWAIVGYVSGNGTTTEVKHYTFSEDQVTPGTYSYRLKQMDYDGRSKYSTEVNIEVAPFNFTLSQNYPNPFNPSTVIKFGIPKSSLVNLKIYDVLGNEVAALVNEEKQAGTYEVNFNGSALSSGVYFYTLTAGEFSSTKKIILMK